MITLRYTGDQGEKSDMRTSHRGIQRQVAVPVGYIESRPIADTFTSGGRVVVVAGSASLRIQMSRY
jgi:hypothetical protein